MHRGACLDRYYNFTRARVLGKAKKRDIIMDYYMLSRLHEYMYAAKFNLRKKLKFIDEEDDIDAGYIVDEFISVSGRLFSKLYFVRGSNAKNIHLLDFIIRPKEVDVSEFASNAIELFEKIRSEPESMFALNTIKYVLLYFDFISIYAMFHKNKSSFDVKSIDNGDFIKLLREIFVNALELPRNQYINIAIDHLYVPYMMRYDYLVEEYQLYEYLRKAFMSSYDRLSKQADYLSSIFDRIQETLGDNLKSAFIEMEKYVRATNKIAYIEGVKFYISNLLIIDSESIILNNYGIQIEIDAKPYGIVEYAGFVFVFDKKGSEIVYFLAYKNKEPGKKEVFFEYSKPKTIE